ncbi:MAG: YhgN family NAAT transporter [Endozoicomonadaceae bacterium]|nr:YhgN family NAAT transporter [Endozoicomonadaceae bacterium]
MEIWSAAILLFLIIDPVGNAAIILSMLKPVARERRNKVLIRELLIALAIMLLFLYLGQSFLSVMNLKQEAVSVSGAIILFIIAIRMIFPTKDGHIMGELPSGEPMIVPLATPLIAGPSLLAAVMLLAKQEPDRLLDWTLAVLASWFVSACIMMYASQLHSLLGERGLYALERLMGMMLLMLSVQIFLNGIMDYVK